MNKSAINIMVFYPILSIVLLLLLSSCNNIEKKQLFNTTPTIPISSTPTSIPLQVTDNQYTSKENVNTIFSSIISYVNEKRFDIPIAVTLNHDTDFEVVKETDDTIYLDWNNSYYKDFMSGKQIEADITVEWPDLVKGYLNVDLDIVNNSDNALDIEELDIIVANSTPDSIPFVYICTELDRSNTIHIINLSWFNWHGMTFNYSILKQGEVFDGTYPMKKHLNYFEHDTILNLLPDMISMGYGFDKLCKYMDSTDGYVQTEEDIYWFNRLLDPSKEFDDLIIDLNKNDYEYLIEKFGDIEDLGGNRYSCICLDIYNKNHADSLFFPFNVRSEVQSLDYDEGDYYYGYARLYGEIAFDDSDYSLNFQAIINLSTHCEFGAGSDENDKFDVELKTQDSDYLLRYPYTTVIEPYGTERISLVIKSEKSSNHLFTISAKNGNGIKVKSKAIDIHYMSPRHYDINEGLNYERLEEYRHYLHEEYYSISE